MIGTASVTWPEQNGSLDVGGGLVSPVPGSPCPRCFPTCPSTRTVPASPAATPSGHRGKEHPVNPDASVEPVPRAGNAGSWLGWWAAALTTGAAVSAWITVLVAPGAPPRSGPNCTATDGSCLTYPYTQAAAFVPNDFIWMIPAFLLGPLLVVVLACLLHDVPAPRRLPARIAQTSAGVAAAVLTVDYYVQFTTVQASLVRGEVDAGLSLLSQYNPHGLFIAMEDLGYAAMLVAFLFSARAINRDSRPARALRWVLGVSGTLGVAMFVALVTVLGRDLEYWFELTGLALSWITLIPAGVLAAMLLRPREPVGR
jgi:hypothetical protein